MNQSSINTTNHYPSPLTLNKKIKGLEQRNKDLQQSIKERIQSLIIQIDLPNMVGPPTQSRLNNTLIDAMAHDYAEMHILSSNQLIKNQIRIQQQSEAREIIHNYEKRISDLRTILVNKEAEIVYETVQLRRDTIPKRENLQVLNNQQLQKQSIKKCLEDLKKVQVQVQALEYAISKKTQNKPCQTNKESSSINSRNEGNSQRIQSIQLRKTNSGIQKDKLLNKVYVLLQNQLLRQSVVQEQLRQCRQAWQNVSQQYRQLCRQYKSSHIQTNKTNTVSILEELKKQDEMKTLFNLKDLNVLKSNTKKQKHRQNLKERRKLTKQN